MLDKQNATAIQLNAGELTDALKRVRHAISNEETRYYLKGVFLHADDKGITLVACDGHRLATQTLKPGNEIANVPGVIIPDTAVADMLKTDMAKSKYNHRDVTLAVSSSRVLLSMDDSALVDCEPIDGTFPDYSRVIPRQTDKAATLERESLQQVAAGMAAFMSKGTSHGRAISLAFENETLIVTCTPEIDSRYTGLDAKAFLKAELRLAAPIAAPITLGFNASYLTQLAASLGGSLLTFHMTDAGAPARIEGDAGDPGALHVLMPVRL